MSKKTPAVVIQAGMDAATAKTLFVEAIEAQSASNVIIKRTRAQLATLAGVVFQGVTITTADAAAALGLELSVKHLDKGATEERAFVQGQRVTLQRALKDAGVLKVDSSKGRKVQDSGEDNDDKEPGAKGKQTQLDVVLRALAYLSNDELDVVAEAVAELHIKALS